MCCTAHDNATPTSHICRRSLLHSHPGRCPTSCSDSHHIKRVKPRGKPSDRKTTYSETQRQIKSNQAYLSHITLQRILTDLLLERPNLSRQYIATGSKYNSNCSINLRRFTIYVHPKFFEATPLRSSIPQPRTDFSKKYNCIPDNNPMAQVHKPSLFETR